MSGLVWEEMFRFGPPDDTLPEIPERPSQEDAFSDRPPCQQQFKDLWPQMLYQQPADLAYRRLYYYLHKGVDRAIARILESLQVNGLAGARVPRPDVPQPVPGERLPAGCPASPSPARRSDQTAGTTVTTRRRARPGRRGTRLRLARTVRRTPCAPTSGRSSTSSRSPVATTRSAELARRSCCSRFPSHPAATACSVGYSGRWP
jgi:hypothetical protein